VGMGLMRIDELIEKLKKKPKELGM